MTHCNAGRLATTGIGTALGVIYGKAREGHEVEVYASETRPLLQGARLTVWELTSAGIPVTLMPHCMGISERDRAGGGKAKKCPRRIPPA